MTPAVRMLLRSGATFGVLMALALMAPEAIAAQLPAAPSGTCTTDPQFDIPVPTGGGGLLSSLVIYMQQVLNVVAAQMYTAITGDGGFILFARAGLTLYIMLYATFFLFGMCKVTLYDFALRMAKLAFIGTLISASGWGFFSGTVLVFFNNGTDDLINAVTQLAVNNPNLGYSGPPFGILDGAITLATSAKMAVTLMAIFATGPYGMVFGLFIVASIGAFTKTLVNALWVYLMSLVVKTLLFGTAPIFISFLLFSRTRHLFDGWLNQLINASLQPILLFMFFGFFSLLIQASIANILATPVCWTEWSEALRGSPFAEHYWRYAKVDSSGYYKPYSGLWDMGSGFPVDLPMVMVLLMLVEMAGRFNNIVVEIAKVLASASTDLRMGRESVSDWFKNPFGTPNHGRRATPWGSPDFGAGPRPGSAAANAAAGAAPGVGGRTGTGLGGAGSREPSPPPVGLASNDTNAAYQAGAGMLRRPGGNGGSLA